jgi:predicted HicB family RNase H-like nuclease
MDVTPNPPRKRRDTRTSTAIRFPEGLHQELVKAAEERDLSVNFLVVAAVRDFLPRLIPADEFSLTRKP